MKIGKLSIIVPVFNELNTVEKVLKKLSGLRMGKVNKEIIVVDDGSTDGTTEILKEYSQLTAHNSSFKFIFKKRNEGKGAAIRSALGVATGDYIIIQDADLEYDPGEIIKLVKLAEKRNLLVVFGSRDREIKNRYLYPHYYWGSKALCLLMNIAFKEKFTDPETCYKLVQTDLMKFINVTEKGFGVEMEMAAKIARLKIPYGEVAITYHPRSFAEGKKIGVKDGIRAIYLIGKYWEHDLHYGFVDRILRRIRLGEALKYLDVKKNQTWADMGCGRQANLGWRIRPRVKRYLGIDRELSNLQMAEVSLINADLNRKITLKSGIADIVVAAAILEHLTDPLGFLKECARILKKGGLLALTTPAPPLADSFLKALVNLKIIKADEVYDHVGYFNLDELVGMIEGAGMKVTKAEGFLGGLNNLMVAKKP